MKGADDLTRRLKQLANIRKEVVAELEDTATDIEIGAIRMAPVSIGQKISKTPLDEGLTYRIDVNAGPIGAYTEFGTGASAAELVPTLPKEWQDIAKQFFINGKGKLIANPYLYPNFFRYTVGLKDRINKIVLDLSQ